MWIFLFILVFNKLFYFLIFFWLILMFCSFCESLPFWSFVIFKVIFIFPWFFWKWFFIMIIFIFKFLRILYLKFFPLYILQTEKHKFASANHGFGFRCEEVIGSWVFRFVNLYFLLILEIDGDLSLYIPPRVPVIPNARNHS